MKNVKEEPDKERVVLVNTAVLNERDVVFLSCKNAVPPSGNVEVRGEANRNLQTDLIKRDKNEGRGLRGGVRA